MALISRKVLERVPPFHEIKNRRRAVHAVRALRRMRRRVFEAVGSSRYSRPGIAAIESQLDGYLDFADGVFVEAGANDGVRQSNTYFLERFRGWRGLLVEPVPELYRRCVVERPRSYVCNCALVALDQGSPELVMRYADLGSTAIGSDEYPFEEVNYGWDESYDVSVPARTLSSLLDEVRINRVDFLCLDVEGYEVQALRGLDLERHAPAFMLIEVWTEERLDSIRAILGSGYELVDLFTDHDAFFRRVDPPVTRAQAVN